MVDGGEYKTEDLYDGTFTVSLPQQFRNIRDKSYVPDNQEVFSSISDNQSFMFEINEPPEVIDTEVARYYFEDLAEYNESSESSIIATAAIENSEMPDLDPSIPKFYLEGKQRIVPGKSSHPPEDVHIFLAIIRLKEVNSDVMISLNIPHKEESIEEYTEKVQNFSSVFKAVIGSFKVVSLDVFKDAMHE